MRKLFGTLGAAAAGIGLFLFIISLSMGRSKPIPPEQEQPPSKEAKAQSSQETAASTETAAAGENTASEADSSNTGSTETQDNQPPQEFRRRGDFGEGGGDRSFSFGRRSDRRGFGGREGRFGPPEQSDPNQPGDQLESVQLSDMEMKNIIQKLAEWTHKPVIPVNDEIMQTKITIYSPEKLPRDKALSLLVAALYARGVLVDQTGDTIFLKPLATARLGAVPTLGIDEPLARIADSSQVVEKWFQLNNYNASQMAEVVSSLIADYGHVTADEATGRISVIDTVENLRRIEQVVQQLDVPESEQTIEKIFELKNADPVEVVQVINLILGEDTSNQNNRSRFNQRGGRFSRNQGPGGGSSNTTPTAPAVVISAGDIPIRLIPMPKQRWILARAGRDDMAKIEEWVNKLDIGEAEESKQQVFQVRYAGVREVANMLEDAIRQMPGTDIQSNIVVQALQETNQIVVFGSDENRKIVEKLIAQIDMPKEDIFIERTFKLKHADPDKIKEHIEGLYESQAGSYSSTRYGYSSYSRYSRDVNAEDAVKVVSYPTMRQVTVIASEKNMNKIARQIEEEWDIPLDLKKDQYRILTLQNSDPVQMGDLLSRLFSEEDDSTGSRSLIRLIFGGEDESKSKIVGSLYGMLTFEPVPDTKKIIVISKIPEAYDVIEDLVTKLDSKEKAEVPKVITLKYADAEDLCDQLNAILNESGTTATLQRSVRGLSEYNADEGGATTTEEQQQQSAGTIRPWWTTQRNNEEQMPASNLIGQVRFIPVARSKAILVLAPPEYMEDIEEMVTELDLPGMQVMLKVLIMEVDHSDVTSLGVELSTDPTAFGTMGINSIDILNELTTSFERNSFSFSATGNIDTLVDLLMKKTKARILNQPTLWTKDNEEAIFVKAQKVAFITSDSFDRTNTNSVQRTFDFEDVGVTLRMRPNITPEKAVDVTIHLNISPLEDEIVNTQPIRKNLDTMTHMIVNDGQSIILGGLLFQNQVEIIQKVPLLGDLPVLGGIFRHTDDSLINEELLVFVTPYVIDEKMLSSMPTETPDQISRELMRPHKQMKMELGLLQEAVHSRFFDPNSTQ